MLRQRSGFQIAKLFGFRIHVDFTLLLLVGVFILFDLQSGVDAMARTLMFFACLFLSVTWHELGHAFTTRKLGLGESQIFLNALGGLAAYTSHRPPTPREGIRIAAAGPLYGLAFGLGLLAVYTLVPITWPEPLGYILRVLIAINLVLNIANLLPIFPLDGGQIMRYTLARRHDELQTLRRTAIISLVVLGFVMVGVFVYSGVSWIFVWVILLLLGMENVQVLQALRRRHYRG